jgi:hypothetical protein
MKKYFILMLCIFAMAFFVSCELNLGGDEGDDSQDNYFNEQESSEENKEAFDFNESYLPGEVSIREIENLGYTLMPSDGDNLLYKYYNPSDGINEMQFTYIKTNELGSESFITTNIKLLNSIDNEHEELIDKIYSNAAEKSEIIINEGTALNKKDSSLGYLDIRVLRLVAIVENGKTTDKNYEAVNGVYVYTSPDYLIKIESNFLPLADSDVVIDAAIDYSMDIAYSYQNKVSSY